MYIFYKNNSDVSHLSGVQQQLIFFSYEKMPELKRVKNNSVGPFEDTVCLGTSPPL